MRNDDSSKARAASTSLSLTFETILLFVVVRSRLGLHVLAFGKRQPAA